MPISNFSLLPVFSKAVFIIDLNPLPTKPWFLHVCNTSLLKTLWEKEKLLITSVFRLLGELYAIFIKFEIVVCNLFHFGIV